MKTLTVQIQPDLLPDMAIEEAVNMLKSIQENASIERGGSATSGSGGTDSYFNVSLETDDIARLWHDIQKVLDKESAISNATIVVCEGEDGWKDYLLLHHFDKSVATDKPSR